MCKGHPIHRNLHGRKKKSCFAGIFAPFYLDFGVQMNSLFMMKLNQNICCLHRLAIFRVQKSPKKRFLYVGNSVRPTCSFRLLVNYWINTVTFGAEIRLHSQMPKIIFYQGGHWSGQSQGNLIFLQGRGNLRNREKLNTKEVREKSGNFIILAQNICCSRYFDYLKCGKKVFF